MPDEPPEPPESILGLPTDSLAGVTVEELLNNKTALTILFHYYRELKKDNSRLTNNLNTAQTYINAYDRNKVLSTTAAWLLAASNIPVGFGVNLLSGQMIWPGIVCLAIGIGMIIGGLIFSRRAA